jgi:hypothetical protein
MDKKFVCACGLTCFDCMFYQNEVYETANKLKQLIGKTLINIFFSIIK